MKGNIVIHNLLKSFLLLSLFFTASSFLISKADDPCKNIQDLDDRAACYEKEIEEREEEYQSTSKKLSEVRSKKNDISSKINELAGQLNVTQAELNEVDSDIKSLQAVLEEINKNLTDRKDKLSEKIALRNHVIRNYSKRTLMNDLELFFGAGMGDTKLSGFQLSYMTYMFNKSVSDEAIKLIKALNAEIGNFEKDKAEAEKLKGELETEKNNLVALKNDLDNRKANAQGEYSELDEKETGYERDLENIEEEIEDLSEKQQAILKAKYGDENGTVGDYASPTAKTPDPPFKPAFAAFSYGAYTHYNGMSQYGAKGRAEDGDDYKEILEFYYKTGVEEKDGFPDSIEVQGHGKMDFQKYLYGIAEMPGDWPMDALKAQAIAARTYAYRSNKPICTTQSCQVFLKSKSDNPPSRWKQAVDDTEDKILKDPKTSQYSSTTGGYINNVGWDADGKWPGDAYEKKAGSPWFYKAWYTKSYNTSESCGHPHPWLTEKEMADILNAWVVWRKGSNSDKDRISPVTTSCWGGDPYSVDKMADKAAEFGEKYTSVSSVDVDISNGGYTSKVYFQTNRGSVAIDGDTFKTVYNLRAPAYISIKSRLFDLERRN
ncbi:hypothetical protein C4561_03685 [candidate division WWE3 bacterium]|jgi:peptidoglycan hydrolase CwlO-like protein|uniref:Sporulation stage II protein D amidase enhancer LytB N-terminal domain-containing protein n=1 Tax=candidate division WWE3 bacterium TaxID=2053526 RepID=A0A3A4ZC51_UNCKA|nr:MAG: hypothetical protein C4561_03685 [candidate division WWE3 bacterium]